MLQTILMSKNTGGIFVRFIKLFTISVLATFMLTGCGWKFTETPLRLQGRVIDAESGKPVEGAFIDVADEKDKLDFAFTTEVVTDESGNFDTIYKYSAEDWIWLGLPVFWLPDTPKKLHIEAFKKGYRRSIVEVDSRPFKKTDAKGSPPNRIPTIQLRHKKGGG